MPAVGAIGAISVANRRARSRNQGHSAVPRVTHARKYSPSRQSEVAKADTISETASVESKSSMFSILKQQVQETTGFLKKQQQALSDKVQKGIKMPAISAPFGVKWTAAQAASTATPKGTASSGPIHVGKRQLDPSWMAALEQKGFDMREVQEATSILGGQPSKIDDMLQVLSAIRASKESSKASETSEASEQEEAAKPESSAEDTSSLPPPPLPPPVEEPPMQEPAEPVVDNAENETTHENSLPTAGAAPSRAIQRRALSHQELVSLRGMGFESEAIHQATCMLGPTASMEQLFELLLAMGSPLSPPNSGTASSSTDGMHIAEDPEVKSHVSQKEKTQCSQVSSDLLTPSAAEGEAHEDPPEAESSVGNTDNGNLDNEMETPTSFEDAPTATTPTAHAFEQYVRENEAPVAMVAAALLRVVFAKAAEKMPSPVNTFEKEDMFESAITASPVKGGA